MKIKFLTRFCKKFSENLTLLRENLYNCIFEIRNGTNESKFQTKQTQTKYERVKMEFFILGIVAGAALGVLYTKRDEVKKAFGSPEFKGKVDETKRASKRVLDEAKDKVESFLASEAPKRRGRKPGVKAKATTTATKTDKVAKASKATAEKVGRKAKASTGETATGTSTGRKTRAKKVASEATKATKTRKPRAKKADTTTKVATPRKPRKPRTPKVADTAAVAPSTNTAQQ